MTLTSGFEIGLLARERATVGEGPVVSADGRTVHWVDIFDGAVHTTELASGETRTMRVDTFVGAIALRRGSGFVAATREGFGTIDFAGSLDTRLPILPTGIRMNDGACDSAGRFWAGSTAMDFSPGEGALHVLLPNWTTRRVLDGLTQPNGLGWSPDNGTFYLVDSVDQTLSAYAFDPGRGELADGRVLCDFSESDGIPDGLTVDAVGDIWVAMWGGGQIIRLSKSGMILQHVTLPVTQPSSCAFAGPHRDNLVVTSATQGLDVTSAGEQLDGSLLCVKGLPARGIPSHTFGG